MLFQLTTFSKPISLLFLLLISVLLILSHESITAADIPTTNIGAIIDVDSRSGKEQKTAMTMAVTNFNKNSKEHKLIIHFQNASGKPLQAAYAAEKLIKENQVQVIAGMQTWQEAATVAVVGQRAQVPVISFAAAAVTPPLTQFRWPFLVQMSTNSSQEINCIAAIVHSYNWRRVIAIYEEDMYGESSGMLALLSEALHSVGSEIEYRLVLPPFSSPSDPMEVIREELANLELLKKQSRVFIVLRSSLSMATVLFREAKERELMGRDSVWIIADTVPGLLDSVETSVISSMGGVLGIKTYYSEDFRPFLDFKTRFQENFRLEYPRQDKLEPGIHALRAYDSVTTIAQAVETLGNNSANLPKMLLERILSSNFTGLSGYIRFHGGKLPDPQIFRIMNVVGKRYKELGFWSPEYGFSASLCIESGKNNSCKFTGGDSMKTWTGLVNWPGDLDRDPKGWAMPTDMKKMKIGVPGHSESEEFVKVEWIENSNKPNITGFCIDVFEQVLRILEKSYTLPYEFVPYNGSYDDLIEHVINKTFDAVIGDVTILANRSRYVEFTQPFSESGLLMLVPVKSQSNKAWMFLKPFTKEMWVVTFLFLCYTMCVVWFLEHHSNNSVFGGPWKNQLGTALWFIFTSVFFAHGEKIQSNYTRVVVVVWLFVVMALTSTYEASLTSMLTVPRLEPKVPNIDSLRRTNATVGSHGHKFEIKYLNSVLKLENIKNISDQEDYSKEFESGNITAAFLELPYAKDFLKENCNKYIAIGSTYRIGGLGFVFQKGSPLATDVSEAILSMLENGTLKRIEDDWFDTSLHCLNSNITTDTESLNLQSFWGIYLISGAISTICFLIFLARCLLRNNYRVHPEANGDNVTLGNNSVRNKTSGLVSYLRRKEGTRTRSLGRAPTIGRAPSIGEWSSARWELVSPSDIPEHLEAVRPTEIEIPVRT